MKSWTKIIAIEKALSSYDLSPATRQAIKKIIDGYINLWDSLGVTPSEFNLITMGDLIKSNLINVLNVFHGKNTSSKSN